MKIIRIGFTLLGLFVFTSSYSQVIGVKGGLTLSNLAMTPNNSEMDFKLNPGFHVGFSPEFEISEVFSIQSGLLLANIEPHSRFDPTKVRTRNLYFSVGYLFNKK